MGEVNQQRYVVNAGMEDVPHISPEMIKAREASTLPYMRDARIRGIPALGAGAVWPVPLADVMVDPFELPDHWPRVYALDVGWNRTAVVWGAYDKGIDVLYLYTEHYRGRAEPSNHAAAIKARGSWIPGVIDPAARGRTQDAGHQLYADYEEQGLNIIAANNSHDVGIYAVWERLTTGRLKVFRTMVNWRNEYVKYRFDEKGHLVKKDDHLMDTTRYIVVSGIDIAKVKPAKRQSLGSGIADESVGY